MLRIVWVIALFAGILANLSTAAEPAAEQLQIEQAWIRAMPPTQRMTAGYLVIRNTGLQSVDIVGAALDVAGRAEIHTSREVDGYMRMEKLESLSIPAGQSVALTPGGMHLMLQDLDAMPAPGSSLNICLQLSDGRSACVDAPVLRGSEGEGGNMHQHHHQSQD